MRPLCPADDGEASGLSPEDEKKAMTCFCGGRTSCDWYSLSDRFVGR
jgi:hypothetical protein